MFNFSQRVTLVNILKAHKEYTKELPPCFRDDDEVDELLKIINIEGEGKECQKIKNQQQ